MPSYPENLLRLAEVIPAPLPEQAAATELANRLCGDRIALSIKLVDNRIAKMFWQVEGCVIIKASAAYLAHSIDGQEFAAALKWISEFKNSFAPEARRLESPLAAVYQLPARYKCALLPFEACENFLRERL